MNDVELMNIQMDHIQSHHCAGKELEEIQNLVATLKHRVSDSTVGMMELERIIQLLPALECHLVKVLLEAQAEHQAIAFNQMEES